MRPSASLIARYRTRWHSLGLPQVVDRAVELIPRIRIAIQSVVHALQQYVDGGGSGVGIVNRIVIHPFILPQEAAA